MRGALPRSLTVLGVGAVVLIAILYYASTVDGRPPLVLRVLLTQHLSSDSSVALTTTSVEVDFSEPVDHPGAQAAFQIEPAVRGAFSWSGAAMTFTPSTRLPLRSSFAVHVEAGVRDGAGNPMPAASGPFSFDTVGNPAVVAATPVDGALSVPLDATIEIQFSTLMDTASVERVLAITPSTAFQLRWGGERLTIEPSEPLLPNRRYSVQIGTDARDQAGTPLEASYLLHFETVQSGLGTITFLPAAGVEGIVVTSPIAVLFDRPLDPRSVSGDLLSITPSIAGSLEVVAAPGAAGLVDDGLRLLRFQPSGPLAANTTYEVRLAAGLRGADGSRMVDQITWRFTTGAPSATLSNQVVFLSDRAGIANLWAMNPDGTNHRQLSAELSAVVDYAVAPEGRSFVVGDGANLVLMAADGSNRRVLTEAGLIEFDPSFSPDGALMAFGRADPATGNGLGIWTRSADGGDPRAVELPPAVGATPTASPSPTPQRSTALIQVPLLRAPRFSPDGTRLAFVDDAGRLEIIDLSPRRRVSVRLDAVTPPVWLPDSSGVVVTVLPDLPAASSRLLPAGSAVAPLDPGSRHLTSARIAALLVVRVSASDGIISSTSFGAGAALPAVEASGRYAYLALDPDAIGGRLWVTTAGGGAGAEMLRDGSEREASVAFAPESGIAVVGRVPLAGATDGPLDGVWLLDLATGRGTQLAVDGWLPRWLP